ncbi:MAG: uppP [Deltaproteobacteria bacterium]|nr:uppP [Deltaproteobacteria bacterium]
MTAFEAAFLGLVQGATEFLPVSSSAHLFLANRLLGFQEPRLAFHLLLHLGTLSAVVYFLRTEIAEIVVSLFRRRQTMWTPPSSWGRRDLWLGILATIPTGVIGILFKDSVETGITFWGVGARYLILTFALLLTGIRLFQKEYPDRIEWWEALAIGVVQGLAVFPGLSRSGSTIIFMLLLGVAPMRAAKFSFLISVPAILGASLVAMKGASLQGTYGPAVLVTGFLVSMAVGYIALVVVERLVVKGRFYRFAPYTLALAGLCFYLQYAG